jgi:molybdopterin-guanine dinucleotide biosynthesis protein A
MQQPALTVAILAGGAASRLGGRDKGLELLGGKPMIEWAIDFCAKHIAADRTMAATADGVELLIIANRNLDEYAKYASVRTDAEPGFRGPVAGIASALAAASAPYVLTLPVDCPSPPADLASRLLAALRDSDAIAAVAHDGDRRQPLFALYRRDLAGSAREAAKAGQGAWEWQDAIGAVEVDFADRRQQFHNLNTPEDFAAYADALRSRD